MKHTMMLRGRAVASLLLALLVLCATMTTALMARSPQKAEAFDVTRFVMCDMYGKDSLPANMYQATQTADIPFMLRSKSTMNTGTDRVDSGLNMLLDITGYDRKTVNENIIGRSLDYAAGSDSSDDDNGQSNSDKKRTFNSGKQVSPFDRFGVAGLKFTSYTGEWRYVVVDACKDDAEPQDPKANQYYDSRLTPLSTWEDIDRSKDVRTKQFARGFGAQYLTSISTVISNWIFAVTKFIVTLVLALVGLSFSDVAKMLGITNLVSGSSANSSDGLFAQLFNGIFVPMSVVVVLLLGVWVVVRMVRNEVRLTLNALLRVVLVFVGSFFLAANPALLVSLPNNIAITVQALAATSMNSSLVDDDGMCATDIGGRTGSNLASDEHDKRNAPGQFIESTAKNVQSTMGCMFWQTFLLKPFAQGQFGTDWNHLWGKDDIPAWAKKYDDSASSIDNKNKDWVGSPAVPVGDGKYIRNWAIFQISTQTNAHSPIGKDGQVSKMSSGLSNDWWRIVDALSNYDEKGEHQVITSATNSKWVNPVKGTNESGFGPRDISIDPAKFHYGDDVSAQCGTPIVAASEGVVKYAGKENNGGNLILISHPKDKVDTAYVHVQDGYPVKQGDTVKAGQHIADVGQTGLASGCHLHFEVRDPGSGNWADFDATVNPTDYLKKKGVTLGDGGEGSGGNAGSESDLEVREPIYNTPDDTWTYWIGNSAWNRMGTAASSVLIAIIGLAPVGFFAVLAATYAALTPLIVILLPMMMLFALGTPRTASIAMEYFKTLGKYTVLRIIYGVLMLLSLVLTNIALGYISKVGWWLGMALLVIFSLVLWRLRKSIVHAVDTSRAFSSQMGSLTSNRLRSFRAGTMAATRKGTSFGSQVAAGGINAKRYGGSFTRGAWDATKHSAKNTMYKQDATSFSKNMVTTAEALSTGNGRKDAFDVGQQFCANCGQKLTGGIFGRDQNGNYYCQSCYDAGLAPSGTREAVVSIGQGKAQREASNDPYAASVQQSKLAVGNSEKSQERVEALRTGKMRNENTGEVKPLSEDDAQKYLDYLLRGVSFDIAKAKVRAAHGYHNANVQIPNEIAPYVDRANVEAAWRDGNYDYLEMAYTLAYATWYQETTGKQVSKSLQDMVDMVHDFTSRVNEHKVERRIFKPSKAQF